MVFDDVSAFSAALPALGRLLGIDLGSKTLGLSLSDTGRRIATPMETLRRKRLATDAGNLRIVCERHEVAGIVLGLPINMNGTEGPRAQSTRAFAGNLQGRIDLPILFWDERLSTSAVTRTLLAADVSRRRRAQVVDKMAAAYILQGALDALARTT